MRILVTCPPMLGMMEQFRPLFADCGAKVTTPTVVQTLSEAELCDLVPQHDGWIIGDDPATHNVFAAGRAGRLRAAVKWGIGVDNVDFGALQNAGDTDHKHTQHVRRGGCRCGCGVRDCAGARDFWD